MGENITTIHGHINYRAAYEVLEAHREELVEECGSEQDANATLLELEDQAEEQEDNE